jgi:hypothetical protein
MRMRWISLVLCGFFCLAVSSGHAQSQLINGDRVIVHRRTGTTNTALLSSALPTAASGAVACSKTAGGTSLDGATTCSSTLTNASIPGGHTIGLTSGTAGGTAKRMTVAVTMTID